MSEISVEKQATPRPYLAYLAVLIALSSPLVQRQFGLVLQENFPFPVNRFLSIWVFWIAAAIVLFISVRIENIPLAEFGIQKNTRSLRYRLLEMIAALITGVIMTIILFSFSGAMRNWLNSPSSISFDISRVLPFWVILPAWITAAFMEELLFRSYPIERLTMLTGNRWLASGLCIITFSVFHLIGHDWIHVLTVVFPGAILLTGIYLWRRSLWFVMVIHGVINLPLLFLPLIAPYL